MKKLLYTYLICFSAFVSLAQNKFSKKEFENYEIANEQFEYGDYLNAYYSYLDLRKADKYIPEMNYRIGVCVYKLGGDTYDAMRYLQESADAGFSESYYYLALCYHKLEKFGLAIKHYHYYEETDYSNEVSSTEINRLIDVSLRAQEMIKHPLNVDIKLLGEEINSKKSDYVPLVTANDSFMVFTSRREGSTGNEKDPYNNYFEDIYSSKKVSGKWQKAENVGLPLNTNTHDACVGLSADGKQLIMFRTNEELTGGDLYVSQNLDTSWTKPIKLSENINSKFQEASATLSNDGNTIYFSSNRPGGYGGKDIYRSIKFGNGDWSLPLNLGPTINTPYDDDAPFITGNDTVLYFSSKGHKTIGGYDIFKSTLEEGHVWTETQNLGFPINTVDDDIFFVLTGDDRTGYYSSNRKNGIGEQDIYQIDMLDKSKILTIVKGVVENEKGQSLKAKITVIDEVSNEVQGVYRSNEKNGKYILILAPNKSYKIIVEAKRYTEHIETIIFNNEDNFVEVKKDIKLESEE